MTRFGLLILKDIVKNACLKWVLMNALCWVYLKGHMHKCIIITVTLSDINAVVSKVYDPVDLYFLCTHIMYALIFLSCFAL